jgi:hypothetical protein
MTYGDTFDPTQKQLAGYEAGIAAIIDYTQVLDNIAGGGMGMSAFLSAFLTVGVAHMIGKHAKNPSSDAFSALKAGLYSGVGDMILNGVLGSRIQNPRILGSLATLIGTYWAEM